MMKKIITLCLQLSFLGVLGAQTYNSCAEADAAASIVKDVTYSVGTIDGTKSDLYCTGNGNNVDFGEWVKYVPTDDFLVTITAVPDSSGEARDTRVHVYSGTCGSLVCVAGDDDSASGLFSEVEFTALVGTTYYIVWDDRWNNSDNFEFSLAEDDAPPPPAQSPVTFTKTSIIAPGFYDLGIADMNGDHLDDAISISSDKIYINYQDASQTSNDTGFNSGFTRVEYDTSEADHLPSWSMTIGDYDSDGYNDIMYGSENGVTFMRAQTNPANLNNGNAFDDLTTYEEINPFVRGTADQSPPNIFSQRGNFIDIDKDGDLDAFMCHDLAPSITFYNDDNVLGYTNDNGLGDFSSGGNYASIWVDYNNDGFMDMFMAKCGGTGERPINQLYRNNGNDTFTNVADDSGMNLADNIQTWSAAWGDFDNDGDMDAFVGSSQIPNAAVVTDPDDPQYDPNYDPAIPNNHRLMRNDGTGFTIVTLGSGVEDAEVGHENLTHDFDNDGNLDIYCNGDILFGNGDMTFNRIDNLTLPPGFGGAIGDLNNDGYLDLYASGSIYTNNKESNNNWIKIVTIGKSYESPNRSNRNGIGARIEINTDSGTQIRDVRSGEGFRYANTLNTHFGIGSDTSINYIRVYWNSSDVVDNIPNPTINSTIVIPEGDSLDLNDTLVEDLILYPNPSKEILNLNSTLGFNNARYSIFDLNGRSVKRSSLTDDKINITDLSTGQYILRVINGQKIMTQKFIKY